MVYVTIRDVIVRKGKFVIDMVVSGNIQPNPKDVMDLLTRLFSKLEFDYMKCTGSRLAKLGYYFSELAREKVFIARIPEDTYIFLDHPENPIEEAVRFGGDVVDLFVDTGSPLKHVYIVKARSVNNRYSFTISGLGYTHEDVYVLMDLIPRGEDDGEIHVEVSQGMEEYKRGLLERALKLGGARS
jgi:hypothetical protein